MDFINKNILLIIHSGSLGGAERQALGISSYLTEQYNCNVYLLLTHSLKTTREFDDYIKKSSILQVFHFGEPYLIGRKEFTYKNLKRYYWSLKYLLKMRKGLLDYKIDIILPFLNFPSKVAFYLYKILPTVKFTFWHQLGLDIQKKDVFETIAAKNIPCVIANASNGLDYFREDYELKPNRAFILPQYISMKYEYFDRNKIKGELGIKNNDIIIGMVAHFRPEKHQELLIKIFKKIACKYPYCKLILLGNINNTVVTLEKFKILKSIIKNYKLENKILLLNDYKVEKILSILDIGVLLSRIEGTPNSVMEYMLYNLPVVSTNHPGCRELLKNSEYLIENKEQEIFSAIENLVLSKKRRVIEGKKNKKLITEYTKEKYVQRLVEIMNQFV